MRVFYICFSLRLMVGNCEWEKSFFLLLFQVKSSSVKHETETYN